MTAPAPIDLDDADTLLELDRRARNLAAISPERCDREVEKVHKRAQQLFMSQGAGDIEAFLAADDLVGRLAAMIERHRRRSST